jgi:hypothetical protein
VKSFSGKYTQYVLNQGIVRTGCTVIKKQRHKILSYNLTDQQWKILERARDMLEPFMNCHKQFDGEKYVTLSIVLTIISEVPQSLLDLCNLLMFTGTLTWMV